MESRTNLEAEPRGETAYSEKSFPRDSRESRGGNAALSRAEFRDL
jgi:hypothetical protein